MSNERRGYVKRKRAAGEARTRRRIAQAAVDLHGSVGPAFTTITAVAEAAEVRRATVYRHFPDEAALYSACSELWISQHPLPDIAFLGEIGDGQERLSAGLDTVYGYYRPNVRMLSNVLRDVEAVPALRPTLAGVTAWSGALHGLLTEGLAVERQGSLLAPALAHAIGFPAWHALCMGQGLPDARARDLMCAMVGACLR